MFLIVCNAVNLKLCFQIFKGCGRPGGMSKRSTDDFFIEGTNNRQRRDDDPALIARSVSVQPNLDTYVMLLYALPHEWAR